MLRTTTVLCDRSEGQLGRADIYGAGVTAIDISGMAPPTISFSVAMVIDFDPDDVETSPSIGLDIQHKASDDDPFTAVELHPDGLDPGYGLDRVLTIRGNFPDGLLQYGGGRLFLTTNFTDQPVPGPGILIVRTSINAVLSSQSACVITA